MMLPDVNGSAVNGSTNNGGGFGEQNIELRGLDAKRTVVLIDGRRFGAPGNSNAVDVGQIPAVDHRPRRSAEGRAPAPCTGSDRDRGRGELHHPQGPAGRLKSSADYGSAAPRPTPLQPPVRPDLRRPHGQGFRLRFCPAATKVQNPLLEESRRDFSKFATYAAYSSIYNGGSSRTPTGSIFLPSTSPLAAQYGCSVSSGTVKLTKVAGAVGTAPDASYRCFNGGGPNDDHYNFAPLNYLVTPQDRGSIFSNVNYKINDNVTAYASILYNRTHSGFQEASNCRSTRSWTTW